MLFRSTLGGSLENAILIDGNGGIVNPEGYRYENELARHKLLDAVGDLSTAGAVIIGRFSGVRSGHALNNALLQALFADSSAYAEVLGESYLLQSVVESLASQPHAI